MSTEKLNTAIALAKSGDKSTAQKLLMECVREDPSNEAAWLWLSVCVKDIEQKKYCIRKALSINPDNKNARIALEKLQPVEEPSLAALVDGEDISSPPPHQGPIGSPNHTDTSSLSEPSHKLKIKVVPPDEVGKYVHSVLMPGERVVAVARISSFIFLTPISVLAVAIICTFTGLGSTNWNNTDTMIDASMFFALCLAPLWIFGIIRLIFTFLRYNTTEFAVTDQRIIGKSGIINRHSLEIVLGKVESIEIVQGFGGRLLNYGTLVVTGSGGTHQLFPSIDKPTDIKMIVARIVTER